MARKLTGLQRVLDVPSLAAVAYGEIASSIYFALGIIALYALGVTPWIVLAVGALFVLVSLSYAEGTAAFPETGGAATFVRRAFNDPAGFLTGWVLFLDYLIVIALAALFTPHYIGTAVGWEAVTEEPWDVVFGVGVIVVIAALRLVRRSQLYRVGIAVAAVALTTHLLLVGLGFAFLLSRDGLSEGIDLGTAPTWNDLAFALPLGMLAYTGLETVANLAAEARDAEKTVPRSLFWGIGAVVVVSVAVAVVGMSAYPTHRAPGGGWETDLGTTWLRAPLVGIAAAFDGSLPNAMVEALKWFIGITGAIVLAAAVTTSISGVGRLAYSLARHEMLPHAFARLSRRTLIPPVSIVAAGGIACVLLLLADAIGSPVRFLAGLYSFGILIAFAAAQLAVLWLRVRMPDRPRPFRSPGNIQVRGVSLPVAALVGLPLTLAVFGGMLATHQRALAAGGVWVALGAVVFVAVRAAHRLHLFEQVEPAEADIVPEQEEGLYRRILVPLKTGPIGEDVLGTAIKLAEEQGGSVTVLHVVRVPLDRHPDVDMPDEEARAQESIADAKQLAAEHGVDIEAKVVRHQDLGAAIVDEATQGEAELIVMGSSPRWRRWSLFVSPTVDKVLRKAQCEVMVVAYPEGYLDENGAPEEPPPS